jgi:peptidoglycan/LPS O-acetylase OafA/YrhL
LKTTPLTSKPHYQILDGLRGVAAVMVVIFHIFETHATSHLDQIVNHGYLAVDFFFVLSGFVVGFAYDDRWGKMSVGGFFKRRLIRLQPMVVIGMLIGAVCFYFQDSTIWPAIHAVPIGTTLLLMAIGMLLVPVPVSMDSRGWHEMYPLNGPGWTLFFEYIANIMYGLFIRKLTNKALAVLVVLAGGALIHYAVTSTTGDVVGGWSLEPAQLRLGFTRMMYPFFAGLLLSRTGKLIRVKNAQAFLWCSLAVVAVLVMPRIGGSQQLWMNGLYDSLVIIFIFPLIVFLGASSEVKGKFASRACKFLGGISYPIYITHYPFIYLYTGWVYTNKIPFSKAFPIALLVIVASIACAYACLKLYDEPVRRWLTKRVLGKGK